MRRYDLIVTGQIYHVYNRGLNKANIFLSHQDYQRFLKTIMRYQNEYPTITLFSYCLLPNHFHFLLKDAWWEDKESVIPHFMRKLQNSYAKYFNMVKERKGQFFEWRYQAKIIDTEDYFYSVLVYVNSNAIKHWIIRDINDWQYSSYHNLVFNAKSNLNTTPVLDDIGYSWKNFIELYNKYIDLDLTPVLEWQQ